MILYALLFLPYALQLLCLVHILKTHRESFWIWIIIMIPYAGGIAYLLVELLPQALSRRKLERLHDSVVKPGSKLKALRQKAHYSPTHGNQIEYADASI